MGGKRPPFITRLTRSLGDLLKKRYTKLYDPPSNQLLTLKSRNRRIVEGHDAQLGGSRHGDLVNVGNNLLNLMILQVREPF